MTPELYHIFLKTVILFSRPVLPNPAPNMYSTYPYLEICVPAGLRNET